MKKIELYDCTEICLTIESKNLLTTVKASDGKKEVWEMISRLIKRTIFAVLFLTTIWGFESMASEILLSNSNVFLLTDSRKISFSDSHFNGWVPQNAGVSSVKYVAEPVLPFSSFGGTVGSNRNIAEQGSSFVFFGEDFSINGVGSVNTNASGGCLGCRGESTGSSIFNAEFSVFSTQKIDISGQLFADAWSDFGGPVGEASIKLMKRNERGREETIYEQTVFSTPVMEDWWVRDPQTKTIDYHGSLSSGIYTLLVEGSTHTQGAGGSGGWRSEGWVDWDFNATITPNSSSVSSVPTPGAFPLLSFALGMIGLVGRRRRKLEL